MDPEVSVPVLPPPEVGDVVRLKSGGMHMTIVALDSTGATVAWSAPSTGGLFGMGSNAPTIHRDRFPIGAIELVRSSP
jgi:hypothetical protein